MNLSYLQYRVESVVSLSRQDIEQIKLVAQHHYDSTCQGVAALCDNWLEWNFNKGNDECEILLKWNDLDLIAKVLEQEHYHNVSLSRKWATIFKAVRDERERVNAHQMMDDTETWSQSFRDDLKRKYGNGHVMIPKPQPSVPAATV